MTHTEHRQLKAVSASDIKEMARSMAHFRYYKGNPQPSTPSMIFGEAVHMAILEPSKFNAKYVVFDDESLCREIGGKKPRATNAYKDAKDNFETLNRNKNIIDSETYTQIVKISKAVKEHPTVGGWLSHPHSQFEKALTWQNGNTPMKMRADHILDNVIIDYKTCQDARSSAFSRDIWKYGYYLQSGIYCEGLESTGIEFPKFIFVAIESGPPYGIMVYELDADTIDYGKSEANKLLREYERCIETGHWTGYDTELSSISLPLWAYSMGDD